METDEWRAIEMRDALSDVIQSCPNISKIRLTNDGKMIGPNVINFGNVLGKSVHVSCAENGCLDQQIICFGNILGKNICVVCDLSINVVCDINIYLH